MNYWLDLFTGTTWREFRDSGATISGFSNRMRNNVDRLAPGDVLLCYLTGVMRWVGALEVVGPSHGERVQGNGSDRSLVPPSENPETACGRFSTFPHFLSPGHLPRYARPQPRSFASKSSGAISHVINRGYRHEPSFLDHTDQKTVHPAEYLLSGQHFARLTKRRWPQREHASPRFNPGAGDRMPLE